MQTSSKMPRDVLAMLHLLSRWLQSQAIDELRIEPGERDEARITRLWRAVATRNDSELERPQAKRRLVLGAPTPALVVRGLTDRLPLTYSGGTGGLKSIRLFKRCPCCKRSRFIEEFSRQPGQADGHYPLCRVCKVSTAKAARERRKHRPDKTAAARFWPHVEKNGPNGCWLWLRSRDRDGYGHFAYKGRDSMGAHLVAYELVHGQCPPGLRAHHLCGNHGCVNPDHLVFATHGEIQNKYAKENPFNRNKRSLHCIRGHAFSPSNTHHFLVERRPKRVCLACLRLRAPGTKKRPNRPQDAMAPRAAKLIVQMENLTRELPVQIRDDARALLHVEILSGRVKSKDELPLAIARARKEAWREQPSRWQESLDAPAHPGTQSEARLTI